MTAPPINIESPESTHGLRRGEFVVLMSLVSATIAISIDTVLPAFDEIEAEFGLDPDGGLISLTITVFLAAMGVGMLIWGPLSDRFGRKPVMFATLAMFIAGAMVSTLASSFAMFLVGRVIWGVAAAGPRAVGLAVIRDSYTGDLMSRIMSLTSAVFLLVPVVAPGVGEIMLTLGSWRLTTAVGAGLGVIVLVWLIRINETLQPDNMIPLEFGRLTRAGREVITHRRTVLFTIATTMAYGAFFPWLGSSIQMFDEIYDRGGQFALLFGANAVLMALAILATERMVNRFSTSPVVLVTSIATVAMATIYVLTALSSDGAPSFWLWFTLASILTALSAATSPLTQTMSMESMGHIAGMASSVTGAFVFIVGAVLGGVIDRFIVDTVTPFGVGFFIYGVIGLAAIVAARAPESSGRATDA
ncbi:MAG: MFS transporter [Acidimicrobiales bacterium]